MIRTVAGEAVQVVARRVGKQRGEGHRALLDKIRYDVRDICVKVDKALVNISEQRQCEHGFRYRARLEQHIRVHREILAVASAAGAVGDETTVSVMDSNTDAVALPALDAHGFIHIDAIDILDDSVGTFYHPHQHSLIVIDDAGLPEAGFMIDVQAQLVLRIGGQEEPVSAVFFEVVDDLLQSGLTVALALFVPVNHEAPEPVAVVLVLFFRIECEHAEAHQLLICIDGKGPGHAGLLRVSFVRLSQRDVVWGDEGLILSHGKDQNSLSIIIIDRFQFNYHNWFFPVIDTIAGTEFVSLRLCNSQFLLCG